MASTNQSVKKAAFAMGCFWGCDGLFGCAPGVVRTRVGYCGGTLKNPTYHHLGDHTETIEIDYDSSATTYTALLELFWKKHDPTVKHKTQYKSAVFCYDEEQKKLAEETKIQEQKTKKIVTEILPFVRFYDAEDYHQKYHLQTFHSSLFKSLKLPKDGLITSTVAAKLNGYVSGHGTMDTFNKECASLGLSDENADYVRQQIQNPNMGVC